MLGQRKKVSRNEEREILRNVAHMLNRLRSVAEEAGQPLSGQEEGYFWKFIEILPGEDQTSVIN